MGEVIMTARFAWTLEEADASERCIECGDVCYLYQYRLSVHLGESTTLASEFVRCESCGND